MDPMKYKVGTASGPMGAMIRGLNNRLISCWDLCNGIRGTATGRGCSGMGSKRYSFRM